MFDVVEGIYSARMPSNEEAEFLRHKLAEMSRYDLRCFLRKITTDMSLIERIARESYMHTNGFMKIPLTQKRGVRLRLHVWGPRISAAQNIHNHKWAFASRVLVGNVREQRFIKGLDGVEVCAMRYLRPTGSLSGEFVSSASCVVSDLGEVSHMEDETYAMPDDIFHRVITDCQSDMLMTLVLTGTRRLVHSYVLSTAGQPPGNDLPREPISADRLREVLSSTIRLI